jgi:hypothetical protein
MSAAHSLGRKFAGFIAVGLVAATIVAVPAARAGDAGCATSISFDGGSGTGADPYQVGTAQELGLISSDSQYWDDAFVQTADIDLESCPWVPIGDPGTPFTGVFDGAGFSISNLKIDESFSEQVGLFGVIYNPGEIAVVGVNLVDVDITGLNNVGSIAGTSAAIITRSSATGVVIGGGEVNFNGLIGGLVGENGYRIDDTRHPGLISYSVSKVDVIGVGGRFVGGLVGYNRQNSSIVESYARGAVTTTSTDPTFNPVDSTGGFAGYNGSNATIALSYSTGATSSNGEDLGGFLGSNDTDPPAGQVSASFWDSDTSGQDVSAGGTAETTAAMTSIGTFEAANWGIVAGWAPFAPESAVWGICPEVNDGYPYLLWEYAVSPCGSDPGPAPTPEPEPAPVSPRFTG